ncbi:MAG: hypothetical protein ABSA69_09435 [Verrucomicrobiota bacterium]|jgi:hypothetical protein
MVEVEANKAKNLLTIRFSGDVVPEETQRSTGRLKALVAELKPGFRLLTDLRGLATMDRACLPDVKSNMDLCNQKGISKVVRIIPDPEKDIGFNILSLFHYRHGIPIITCETAAEAMKALSG